MRILIVFVIICAGCAFPAEQKATYTIRGETNHYYNRNNDDVMTVYAEARFEQSF